VKADISYGKARVPLYRVYARPLTGVTPIPESPFTGRDNTLFALEVDVEVFGRNFLPAYTEGDNANVVATDSMKNYILRQALAYDGATLEGFLNLLARGFLDRYKQMQALRLSGRERPFAPTYVPSDDGGAFIASPRLFGRSHGDHATGVLDVERDDAGRAVLTGHRCGRVGMELIKVTGSAFTRFVRDGYTTLPERVDRPLYIHLDVHWTYHDTADLLAPDPAHYIPSEQVLDVVRTVFHQFVSESIQHLVHEIGTRLLQRFPGMATVSFDAQNHTWDPVALSEKDPNVKVYSEPFPAYGIIRLTLSRDA